MKFETFYHRGKALFEHKHYFRAKIYRIICKMFFSTDVPFQASIDKSVYFCHNAFGVVINPNAIIGGVP